MFNIPHGVICGTLMAPANSINIRELRKRSRDPEAMNKYIRLGRLFLNDDGKSDDYYIDGFVEFLRKLTDDMKLQRLGQYGIKEEDLGPICRITELKNNPVKLTTDNLIEILRERL
jgi:alcohol dehydrogenase class IV